MQSYRVKAAPDDHLIRLPADIELPAPVAGVYALPQPDSQEWTVTLMVPISATELARWPELQRIVMHAGGYCAPPSQPLVSQRQSPSASRLRHLQLL